MKLKIINYEKSIRAHVCEDVANPGHLFYVDIIVNGDIKGPRMDDSIPPQLGIDWEKRYDDFCYGLVGKVVECSKMYPFVQIASDVKIIE